MKYPERILFVSLIALAVYGTFYLIGLTDGPRAFIWGVTASFIADVLIETFLGPPPSSRR